jgi:hypothetical protein
MFLADNAPHSFQVFHESYGDENVVATPWKIKQKKKTRSSNDNTIYEDEEEKEEEGSWGMLDRYERTITYHTKISPGSSSNPLVSSSTTNNTNSNSLSNNMIPLGVSIIQTLIKNSNTRVWVLQCEFSFDFLNSTSPPSSSSMSSIASSTNNTSNSGSGSSSSSVGKKLLGTTAVVGGLSQYFMSHVVKGSTVNVSIILRECDEGGADTWQEVATAMEYVQIAQDHHPATSHFNNARGGVTTSSSNRRHQQHHHPQRQTFCQEDIFSCFSHPLLLPPDGLCGSGGRGTSSSSWRAKGKSSYYTNNCINIEEPSKIGASLLSAIKAKNAPSATDFASSSNKTVADVSLAMFPLVTNSEESNNTVMKRLEAKTNPREQKEYYEQQEDVLAYCSSRGSMKVKNIPSELSRAPSTISMRRMILDKTETTTASANAVSSPSRSRNNADSINTSSPVHSNAGASSIEKFPQGISMRIQMELVDSSSCPTSPLPFSRSPSIPTIDDKIRRGLKKRFARSWVSWAESWCMRVWEEEEAERVRKKALGVAMHDPNKKNKVNVRPIVRRVGDLEGKKKKMLQPSEDTPTKAKSSSSSKSSSVSTDDNGWKPMQVKGSPTRKSERWMAIEREDECGVEVECTVSVAIQQQEQRQQQKRRLKAVDINQNKEQGSNRAPVKRSGLLKHRRNKLI